MGQNTLVLGLVASTLSLNSCVQEEASLDQFRIGLIAPLSGETKKAGDELRNAAELSLDVARNKYPRKDLVLIVEDGQCSQVAARQAMIKLVDQDKVDVVLGGLCSAETIGAAPIANQNSVVLLSPTSSAPQIRDAGAYVYRTTASSDSTGESLGAFIGHSDEAPPMLVLWSTALDSTRWTSLISSLEKTQIKTTLLQGYAFSQELIAQKNFVLDGSVSDDLFDKQLKILNESNPSSLFLLDALTNTSHFRAQLLAYPNLLEGTVGASFPSNLNHTEVDALMDDYRNRYGATPDFPTVVCQGYDGVQILVNALFEAQGNAQILKKNLDSPHVYDTLSGRFYFNPDGEPVYENYLYTIKDGKTLDLAP